MGGQAGILEYQEEPRANDNFLEARFRYAVPHGIKRPKALLVLLQGTDSDARPLAEDAFWLRAAGELEAGLVACFFRGEGKAYEDPSQGSGEVLLRAIAHFGEESGTRLEKLPLLMWGHSAGGQFACHFACWKPERTAAFVLIKAGPYACEPDARVAGVAGLFVAGERDTPGRIRSIVQGYEKGRALEAPWAFLLEKQSGHELGKTNEVALPFLQEALDRKTSSDWQACQVEQGSLGEEVSRPSAEPALAMFPGLESARNWARLHRPAALGELASLADPPSTESPVQVEPRQIQLDASGDKCVEQKLVARFPTEGLTVKAVTARPACFQVREGEASGGEGKVFNLNFDPRELPWGPVRGELRIFTSDGKSVQEPVEVPLYAEVQGPLAASPKSLYFGVVKRGEAVERSLVLQAVADPFPALQFEAKGMEGIEVIPAPVRKESGRREYACRFKPQGRLGTCSGEIRVYLDGNTNRWLRLPCFAYVQP